MAFPIRKSPRLSDYDYRANGYYFITICTHRKEKLLCKIVGEGLCALPSVILSDIGQSVYEAIRFISENFTGVSVDHYVIMPNYIHMLICFCRDSGGHGDPPLHDVFHSNRTEREFFHGISNQKIAPTVRLCLPCKRILLHNHLYP